MICFMKPTLQLTTPFAVTVDLYKFQVCVSNLSSGTGPARRDVSRALRTSRTAVRMRAFHVSQYTNHALRNLFARIPPPKQPFYLVT